MHQRRPPSKRRAAPVVKALDPEARIARTINSSWQVLQDFSTTPTARRLLGARDTEGYINAAPWGEWIQKLGAVVPAMQTAVGDAITAEYRVTARNARADLNFTAVDDLSVRYAQTQAGKLIRSISDTQRETVRRVMGEALAGQYTGDKAARLIRNTVGLHPAWAQAVVRHRDRVLNSALADGKTLDKAEAYADKQNERYAAGLLRRRADNIARTEIITSENLGRFASWADAIGNGYGQPDDIKEWDAELNHCCDACHEMHGETVQWDQPFSNGLMMPPAHPSCRCAASKRAKPIQPGDPRYDPELDDPEYLYQPGYETRLPTTAPQTQTLNGITVTLPDAPLTSPKVNIEGTATATDAGAAIDKGFKPGTDDERQAAGLYLGGARFNAALRGGGAIDEYTQQYINDLTAFIKKQPGLPQAATLYRGMSRDFMPGNVAVGDVLTEPAFMSTSLKLDQAELFAGNGNVLMEIEAPKGTRALSTNHATLADQSGIPAEYRETRNALDREAEMILPPGTRTRVTAIEDRTVGPNTYKVVRVTIDPPNAAVPTAAAAPDFSAAALSRHTEDELMDMLTRHGDDPDAVDAILAAIDAKAEVGVHALDPSTAADVWGDASAFMDAVPSPAKRPARKLSRDDQTAEQFDAYVSVQYQRALEATAGNFIKNSMMEEAKRRGITSESLFTGPVATAKKFASEELIAFWEEAGRQTFTSYRYSLFHMPADRSAAEVVRRAGFQGRLGSPSDRSTF